MPDPLSFVQITDCHLYADKNALHYDTNVYQNLVNVLADIKQLPKIKCIIFTGDLTQDHSENSYQNFVDAVRQTKTKIPFYYLAGNHDDVELLNKYLSGVPFIQDKNVIIDDWQIQLVDSKSDTPAGVVQLNECQRILSSQAEGKKQLLLMHHHPVDVGYFIDRHGLKDQSSFYQTLDKINNLKALACGHVHNAMELVIETKNKTLPLFTCPASSIQFSKVADSVENSMLGAGYRIFYLHQNGTINTKAVFLKANVKNR